MQIDDDCGGAEIVPQISERTLHGWHQLTHGLRQQRVRIYPSVVVHNWDTVVWLEEE